MSYNISVRGPFLILFKSHLLHSYSVAMLYFPLCLLCHRKVRRKEILSFSFFFCGCKEHQNSKKQNRTKCVVVKKIKCQILVGSHNRWVHEQTITAFVFFFKSHVWYSSSVAISYFPSNLFCKGSQNFLGSTIDKLGANKYCPTGKY